VIARLDSYDKLARVLMGFEAPAALAGETGLKIRRNGKSVGRVTSLVAGEQGGTLGLCVVNRDAATPGAIEVASSTGTMPAQLVDRPFWI
ncbi:MAG: hypothetical protein HYZ27_03685, partial [Deltaproteobacteria bacterium]|nr:hypothetical protein [Deltaproteobacteria bacterium]